MIQPVAESDKFAQLTFHLANEEESAQEMRRDSKSDSVVVDEETSTHYTGSYTVSSNGRMSFKNHLKKIVWSTRIGRNVPICILSCGGKNRYGDWIEGDVVQKRIELMFHFILEKMLAPEACNQRSLPIV